MRLKNIFYSALLLTFTTSVLIACSGVRSKPKVVDPKVVAAMSMVKVEDFASQGNNGQILSTQIKAALKYEGIKLVAEGEKSAILRGRLNVDTTQTRCANSTDPKKPVYVCDKNINITVNYRLFNKQGNVILTQRETESAFETKMSHTSAEDATTKLKSDEKIIYDALQHITQKIVATLSAK